MEQTLNISKKGKKELPRKKFSRLLLTASALAAMSSGCQLVSDFDGYMFMKKADGGEIGDSHVRDSNEPPVAGRGGNPDGSRDAAVDGETAETGIERDSGKDTSVDGEVSVDADTDAKLDSSMDAVADSETGTDAELDSGGDAVIDGDVTDGSGDAEADAAEGGTDAGPEVCESAEPGFFDGLIATDAPETVGGYKFLYKGENVGGNAVFDILCAETDAVVAADTVFPEGEITTLPVPADGMQIHLECFTAGSFAANVEITVESL